jgi:hypothetical protein
VSKESWDAEGLPIKKIFGGVLIAILFILGWIASDQMFYNVEAGEMVVAQGYFSGNLECWTTPGYQFRKFAKLASFRRSSPVWFDGKHDDTGGLPLRFNDAGKATALGSGQVFMPSDCDHLKKLRQIYGNQEDINHTLVNRVVTKAVYNTGKLLSSSESFAAKRGDILFWIEDQANQGIYDVKPVRTLKPIVKLANGSPGVADPDDVGIQTIEVAIITGPDGIPVRKEPSELQSYGITIGNVVLNEIDYDEPTQKQIDSQRESQQAIQTAKARAIAADQEAITAEANGRAQSAKARADQEVKKATAVTLALQEKEVAQTQADQARAVAVTAAQRDYEVAELKKKSAEQYKAEQVLRGEGDAAYKQKVMEADGALAQKLDTYKATMIGVAEALSKQKLVPDVVLGGSAGGQQSAAGSFDQYLGVMAAKAAQDLKLNLDVRNNKP